MLDSSVESGGGNSVDNRRKAAADECVGADSEQRGRMGHDVKHLN